MSDLTATNCGCNETRDNDCSSIIWLILILSCCGGCGNGCNGNGLFGGDNNCLWIILLLCCCGGGFGNGCGF